MLRLGCILISDLVVANLFMHLLPDMVLFYLVATFIRFMHCYRFRIIDLHIATPAEIDQKIHQSVYFLPLTIQLALIFNLKQEI